MRYADAGLVTSGTATLEAALWGLPEVVCYNGSPVSYWIARMLIKVKFIGLVNLVMDRLVITELIQAELNRKNMVRELNALLHDEKRKSQLQSDYDELWSKLGGAGASGKVADFILQSLKA
jgi:lipid-A-disaccharide synthase